MTNTPAELLPVELPEGMVARECFYNHPTGSRCPVCQDWPYAKGGAAAFMESQRPQAPAQPIAPQIENVREALKQIKALKARPIADTGFCVGPAALLQQAQRIARQALSTLPQASAEGVE